MYLPDTMRSDHVQFDGRYVFGWLLWVRTEEVFSAIDVRPVLRDGGQRRASGVRSVPERTQARAVSRHGRHDDWFHRSVPIDRWANGDVLWAHVARDGRGGRLRDRAQLRVWNGRHRNERWIY